jgi:NhaP-type Na+/H+ or K+/H+ antiporter
VIFGSSLIWSGFSDINAPTIIFVAFALLIRVPVYMISLLGSKVDRRGRLLIAWFGPTGLSSLLLILLAVFAGLPGSDRLFAICSLIVLLSIVLHGASPMLLARFGGKGKPQEAPATPEIVRESRSLSVVDSPSPVGTQSISLEEMDGLQKAGDEIITIDARTERSRDTSDSQAQGSVRLVPENVVLQARQLNLPKEAWLIVYCA